MDIVSFGNNDKWLVITSKKIDNNTYSYLIRINDKEDKFIDEYKVVKSHFVGRDEYMDVVNGNELKKVLEILLPEVKELTDNPEKLKSILGDLDD